MIWGFVASMGMCACVCTAVCNNHISVCLDVHTVIKALCVWVCMLHVLDGCTYVWIDLLDKWMGEKVNINVCVCVCERVNINVCVCV